MAPFALVPLPGGLHYEFDRDARKIVARRPIYRVWLELNLIPIRIKSNTTQYDGLCIFFFS